MGETPDELFKQFEREKESSTKNFLKNVPSGTLILFGIIILVLVIFIFQNKNFRTSLMFLAGCLLLIYLLSMKHAEQKIISERQAKAILEKELKWKRLHTKELVYGEAKLTGICALQIYDNKPIYYEIGFKIITESRLEKHYSAKINCYTGMMMGIEERPSGYTGSERPIIRVARPFDELMKERYLKTKK